MAAEHLGRQLLDAIAGVLPDVLGETHRGLASVTQEPTVERSMQDSPETKAILRRMEEVRCDLDEGAQEIAESARDMVSGVVTSRTTPGSVWVPLAPSDT
jgi:hypothetical protein